MAGATPPFTRDQLRDVPCQTLREGRWANARVVKVTVDGVDWVVKDFAPRAWWVRATIGRFLLGRELDALQRLAGLDGVPSRAFRLDAHAIAARYIPGTTLNHAPSGRLDAAFFTALEALFDTLHARGLVHLDARGSMNVLVTPQGRPALIDFQAALPTSWMPAAMRRLLEAIDAGAVYKHWLRHAPQSLGAERRARLAHSNRWRRLWIGRGYFGIPRRRSPPTGP